MESVPSGLQGYIREDIPFGQPGHKDNYTLLYHTIEGALNLFPILYRFFTGCAEQGLTEGVVLMVWVLHMLPIVSKESGKLASRY